ncbi:MAG: glycine cleavage system aminomethyltransferase GcvT [Myxococcales bacterium]|nr:glycine cleavage system aminomethyltransferase GcvT [Myxococcales bacterium]
MPKDLTNQFLFETDLTKIDPLFAELIDREDERQARQIVLIPSESICSWPVRRVLDSSFSNLYAEGYPAADNTLMSTADLGDLPMRLAHYRRYGDRRFYKGNAYVNPVEALCRRRAAECFATAKTPFGSIFANVQPLSGAAANLAVYEAFVPLGGTVMGLSLMEGGHLTHGSKFNMTGKRYNIVSYHVDPQTELLDYDAILALAKEAKPKMIITGYTSYPWAPDFAKFRQIADEVGAILMADIAHPVGLAIAGAYPNPIDHCDVVTFTTHKTLMGPRGAVILTKTEEHARKIDAAVFPGEQGGPHMNTIAALAVAFHLAQSDGFKKLQGKIVENAGHLADEFKKLGLRLAYGGTDTHKLLIDLKSLGKKNGVVLYGEPAAHILELAGIVLNKNTIPGDAETAFGTGLRMGTPWLTQRGAGEAEVRQVARFIHRILTACEPFLYKGLTRPLPRGKVDPRVLREVSEEVDAFCAKLAVRPPRVSGYPHFPYLDPAKGGRLIKITGPHAEAFLADTIAGDLSTLKNGGVMTAFVLDGDGRVIDEVSLARLPRANDARRDGFVLKANPQNIRSLLVWLRGLSDGFTLFEPGDVTAKIEGPAVIEQLEEDCEFVKTWTAKLPDTDPQMAGRSGAELLARIPVKRPYFIGQHALAKAAPKPDLPAFAWQEPAEALKRTSLYEEHKKLGGKLVPFAGHEMPVRYVSTIEEHNAVRKAAGLFDVSHMGVFEVSGPRALAFLDLVCSNYIGAMAVGDSLYNYLFDHDANLLDDLLVYRLEEERFFMVVNAANEAKDWAWLTAVNEGRVLLDAETPQRAMEAPAVLRNLKEAQWGAERRVDLALQGPKSKEILLRLVDVHQKEVLRKLGRTKCGYFKLAGFDTVASRTGYTGEAIGFEIFVHPDQATALWNAILEAGKEFGALPIGLGARDSLRIEAGLPLYGHELAGHYDITPDEAGFAGYVKLHKPFFIGKRPYMKKVAGREMKIVRFAVPAKGSKPVKLGDPIIDDKGACLGYVTSCATDTEGLLVGQAYVQQKKAALGPILILPLPAGGKKSPGAEDLKPGSRLPMPVEAQIIKRFPKR